MATGTARQHRDVTVARSQPQLGTRAATEQLLRVRGGDDPVLAALHDQHGRLDLLQLEAPRLDGGDVVVDQPVGPGRAGVARVLAERLPGAREDVVVRGREAALVELGGLGVARAGLAPLERRPRAAGVDHALEPVGAARVGREAGEAHHPGDPLGHERGTGERGRPAAGRAHDREAIQPERVGDLRHVARRGGDVAARLRRRPAVARAAVGDEPDAAPGGGLDQRRQRGAALRRSVVPHERGASPPPVS